MIHTIKHNNHRPQTIILKVRIVDSMELCVCVCEFIYQLIGASAFDSRKMVNLTEERRQK
jgi:hypothetical protein